MEKMKKTYSFLFAAVALFAAASCQDELISNETPAVQGERFTVTAAADAQTKTALTDEGLNSVWTPGDAIAVIDFIGNGAEFTTDITENAASARFTCENFNTGGLTDISALPIVALYPYQDGLTCSIQSQLNPTGDNTIKGITFPHEQTAVAGSFDKSAAFTWAMATGATKDNLEFNNLYSLLKVKVTEENITSITVSATSGSLAGKVTLPLTTGALTVVEGQGQSSVTLTCEDGFATDKYYYICILPGTYEGFSIALDGTVVKKAQKDAEFASATVYDLGELEIKESVYGLIGIDGDWNTDLPMLETSRDNFFVAYGVVFDTNSQFKIRKKGVWEAEYNFGSVGDKIREKNSVVGVYTHGDSGHIKVNAGTYDIYFDRLAGQVYIMEPGKSYTEGSKQSKPSYSYGLVGSFTNWSSNIDMDYAGDGVWTVVYNFNTTDEWKVRKGTGWDAAYNNVWVGWELKNEVGNDKNLQMKNAGEYIISFIEKDAKDGNSLITILNK